MFMMLCVWGEGGSGCFVGAKGAKAFIRHFTCVEGCHKGCHGCLEWVPAYFILCGSFFGG